MQGSEVLAIIADIRVALAGFSGILVALRQRSFESASLQEVLRTLPTSGRTGARQQVAQALLLDHRQSLALFELYSRLLEQVKNISEVFFTRGNFSAFETRELMRKHQPIGAFMQIVIRLELNTIFAGLVPGTSHPNFYRGI